MDGPLLPSPCESEGECEWPGSRGPPNIRSPRASQWGRPRLSEQAPSNGAGTGELAFLNSLRKAPQGHVVPAHSFTGVEPKAQGSPAKVTQRVGSERGPRCPVATPLPPLPWPRWFSHRGTPHRPACSLVFPLHAARGGWVDGSRLWLSSLMLLTRCDLGQLVHPLLCLSFLILQTAPDPQGS